MGETYLLAFALHSPATPEEMRAYAHTTTLIRFLQKLGGCEGALGTQRLVVFFAEATHLFKGGVDEGDGCKLGFGIADFVFVQRECLQRGINDVNIIP